MPGDEPGFVVAPGELDERGSQLFDGVEGPHPQQVLLQDPDTPVEVQFTSAGCLNYPCRTPHLVLGEYEIGRKAWQPQIFGGLVAQIHPLRRR